MSAKRGKTRQKRRRPPIMQATLPLRPLCPRCGFQFILHQFDVVQEKRDCDNCGQPVMIFWTLDVYIQQVLQSYGVA